MSLKCARILRNFTKIRTYFAKFGIHAREFCETALKIRTTFAKFCSIAHAFCEISLKCAIILRAVRWLADAAGRRRRRARRGGRRLVVLYIFKTNNFTEQIYIFRGKIARRPRVRWLANSFLRCAQSRFEITLNLLFYIVLSLYMKQCFHGGSCVSVIFR